MHAVHGSIFKPAKPISSVSNPSSETAFSVCLVSNSVLPFFLGLPTMPMTFRSQLLVYHYLRANELVDLG
jgi:hypothetical protein